MMIVSIFFVVTVTVSLPMSVVVIMTVIMAMIPSREVDMMFPQNESQHNIHKDTDECNQRHHKPIDAVLRWFDESYDRGISQPDTDEDQTNHTEQCS